LASYRIKIPVTWKIYNVFNEALLKPYYAPTFPEQIKKEKKKKCQQEQENISGDYKVEELMDSRVSKGRLEYLVKWKNYPLEEASWEPEKNLANAKETITKFHRKHPAAPRKVRAADFQFKRYENKTRQYVPKTLYGWEDGIFEQEFGNGLEEKWKKWRRARKEVESEKNNDDWMFARTRTLRRG
jgi:hypothetical protein